MTLLHEQNSRQSDTLIVFNIQHYSLHDGEGIRTNIFLKGCPLRCRWCCNPESQNPAPEPMLKKIHRAGGEAYETITVGKEYTVSELVKEALKDAAFYGSDGGVTLSGGEPLLQDNVLSLLGALKEEYMNVAVETCGNVPEKRILEAAPFIDHFFFDIKSCDSVKHQEYTGVDGNLIRNNLIRLREEFPQKSITVRTPVIPGFNDTEEELNRIEEFLKKIPDITWQKLPYHTYGVEKYNLLGREYQL